MSESYGDAEQLVLDDVVIVGAGIAGLFAALKCAPRSVAVVSLSRARSASHWAQGGIAAALGAGDSADAHAEDTLRAGAGLADAKMVAALTQDGAARIEDLQRFGVQFDKRSNGEWLLRREGAHRAARILSVEGDRTGHAIMRALLAAADATPSIRFVEGLGVHSLVLDEAGRVSGLAVHPAGAMEKTMLLRAPQFVLATGGAGHLYDVTTNPRFACGQALGMAARAGAQLRDAEFVQFHPTAFAVADDPAPLATEALRGEGAKLVNAHGEYFMARYHPQAELAPRDVVARALVREQAHGRVGLVLPPTLAKHLQTAFPTVHASCVQAKIDPARQPIPVAPAAHYHMGGIAVDTAGRTSLDGLWASGEAASSGAHGGNRLASNSLLEAIVLGARIAADVKAQRARKVARLGTWRAPPAQSRKSPKTAPLWLRAAMGQAMGVVRERDGLQRLLGLLAAWKADAPLSPVEDNIYHAALMMTAGAVAREESRGAHYRSDFPHTDEVARRKSLTVADAEALASATAPAKTAASKKM